MLVAGMTEDEMHAATPARSCRLNFAPRPIAAISVAMCIGAGDCRFGLFE